MAEGRDWISEVVDPRRLPPCCLATVQSARAGLLPSADSLSTPAKPFLPYHHITSLPSSIALGILALVACRQQRPQWPRHLHLELQR